MNRLTEEQRARVPELRKQGYTMEQIAKAFGVSKSCITFWSDPKKYREQWGKANKKFREINPEYVKECHKLYHQMHVSRLKSGEYVRHKESKRQQPDACEVCTRVASLRHHHWDDAKPWVGIWMCESCHQRVEFIDFPPDPGFVENYLALKDIVEKSVEGVVV